MYPIKIMKKNIAYTLVAFFLCYPVHCQQKSRNDRVAEDLTIVFYNVENFFDTKDDPGFYDEEYMPHGAKNWTEERFAKKVDGIAGVLRSINTQSLPAVIGLCEVENRSVLERLVVTTKLEEGRGLILILVSLQ